MKTLDSSLDAFVLNKMPGYWYHVLVHQISTLLLTKEVCKFLQDDSYFDVYLLDETTGQDPTEAIADGLKLVMHWTTLGIDLESDCTEMEALEL